MNKCFMCNEYAFKCPYYNDWNDSCNDPDEYACYMEEVDFEDDDE